MERSYVRIVAPGQYASLFKVFGQHFWMVQPTNIVLLRCPSPNGVAIEAMHGNDTVSVNQVSQIPS